MKKILLIVMLCIFSIQVQAQVEQANPTQTESIDQDKMNRMMELMGRKIEMDVNTELFTAQGLNSYISETPKAAIMAMYVPDSYENSKKKMENDLQNNMTITEKGEKQVNDVTVLYMKGTTEADGQTLNIEMYCMEVDEETCLMFAGMTAINADKKYNDAINKAAKSVIKK